MSLDNDFEKAFALHGETGLRTKTLRLHEDAISSLYDVPVTSHDYPEDYAGCTYYTRDGFMPGYTKMKRKVLFIGKESRWSAPNSLDPMQNASDIIKNTHSRFHQDTTTLFEQRMIAIATLFQTIDRYSSYDELIWENWSEVRKSVTDGTTAFAYLELSKFANCNDTHQVDKKLMNQWKDFDLNHHIGRQQIEMLQPDFIVTLNLIKTFYSSLVAMLDTEIVALEAGDFGKAPEKAPYHDPDLTMMKVRAPWDHSICIPLFDVWHFSAPKANTAFFDPIRRALKSLLHT